MKVKNFSRNCPICNQKVFHTTEKQTIKSKDKLCTSCAKKALWAQEDSPLRREETKIKRNESISKQRQDPNSNYNTEEYKQKKSQAMISAWQTSSSLNSKEYIDKQSLSIKDIWQTEEYRNNRLSEETLKSFSIKMGKAWEDNYEKFIIALKKSWTPERREQAKISLEEKLNDPAFRERWYNAKIIKVSKIENRVKEQLKDFGFIHSSEHKTYVLRYLPDFINFETKQIIEIYGDYWHCNPSIVKYSDPNWIHPKLKLTPQEKWQEDFERNSLIEAQGYKVNILWEADIKFANYDIEKLLGD